MQNLKNELNNILIKNKLTLNDILWVGTRDYKINKQKFLDNINFQYDNGYGLRHIATDLIVVGADFYIERRDYDGSEWWHFNKIPTEPKETRDYTVFSIEQYNKLHWNTKIGEEKLEYLNK